MVDVSLIQPVSQIAAAIGVCIAAFYYVMTLRVQQKNMKATLETRRIGVVQNIMRDATSEDGLKNYFELLSYDWRDYDDFEKKYGSENNMDAAAKRYAMWGRYNYVGAMVRKGIVEVNDIYETGMTGIAWQWEKYKPVIEEVRRRYMGPSYMKDFEYLGVEMLRFMQLIDPSYRIPETFDKYLPDK